MAKKRTSPSPRSGAGASKKQHLPREKTSLPPQNPMQTNQPYEQDVKRRIGHFAGTGEPPLMKR